MNYLKQKYSDFRDIYTDDSKVETKLAFAFVCDFGIRGHRLRDGRRIFITEIEAINKALLYVNVSWHENV